MNKNIILLSLLGYAGLVSANMNDYVFMQGTGAISYTFFNLSPNQCTFTPYGGGQNLSVPDTSSFAYQYGWDLPQEYGPGFFNHSIQTGGGQEPILIYTYVFYNTSDSTTVSISPLIFNTGSGTTTAFVETSFGTYQSNWNPPAIADSWGVSCTGQPTQVIANIASAGAALGSGNIVGFSSFPFSNAAEGSFENALLQPPAGPV